MRPQRLRRSAPSAVRTWAARRGAGAAALLLSTVVALATPPAHAVRVQSASPQGEVAEARQVSVQFDAAVVPAGDARRPDPFTLRCNGNVVAGNGRWASDRQWLFEPEAPIGPGADCAIEPRAGWAPASGTLDGPTRFRFGTGGPTVVSTRPWVGDRIDESQHFLLRLNGPALPASVLGSVWCEVEGLRDRIGVRIVDGTAREQVLKTQLGPRPDAAEAARWLLLACDRPFPADAAVRLVWGAGVASSANPKVVTTAARSFAWRVRPRFTAESSCERERAAAPCMPLRPIVVRFSAPVPAAQALAVRLRPLGGGNPLAPRPPDGGTPSALEEVAFPAPLPENARFEIVLPPNLVDDAGRGLANAASFPLAVATGGMPPLAKFAGAPFGIVEAGPEAMLPMTLRQVQADLAGAQTGGTVRVKRLDAGVPDETLLRWIARLNKYHESRLTAREAGRPQAEWTQLERETDDRGRVREVRRERWIGTRELSLLQAEPGTERTALPQPAGTDVRATEVVGLPLPARGFHVVEIESRVLGHALLATRAPMYVRTGALVTNLGVHFKRGRDASLVWVTSLDRARPVAGAKVVVNDCQGRVLWSGSTGADGIARIDRGFDEPPWGEGCLSNEGYFVTARSADGDLAFVFSRWYKGIEPWRFNLPTATGARADATAHAVFDRTLLRAGETASMKLFVRLPGRQGLALPTAEQRPAQAVLVHAGSGTEHPVSLTWAPDGRAAQAQWAIPRSAKLGQYDLTLALGDRRVGAGSLRVEAFRVPLVDARLVPPRGAAVAPTSLRFGVQLDMAAGGPLPRRAATLSALWRDRVPAFAAFADHSFTPPQAADDPQVDTEAQGRPDGARVIADRLDATTDVNGAAQVDVQRLPAAKAPGEVVAELSYVDPAGEVQTVSQRVETWPAAVVVGVRARSWASARGQVRFGAAVLDTEGRALKGREVEVVGRQVLTRSMRQRVVGGFYAWDHRRETKELGVLCKGKTDDAGRLACDAALEVAGEVELIARARDDAGRLSEAATTVWVTGQGELWFPPDNDDRIDLLPERRELEPGQSTRLQVRMPYREATALVTVEREGVIESRVQVLRGDDPTIEITAPKLAAAAPAADAVVAASWAPNVYVSVLVLRGRVRDVPLKSILDWGWRSPLEWWRAFRYEGRDYKPPGATVDLSKPSFKLGVAQLAVGTAAHRLDVAVTTDRSVYAVRQTVKARVKVTQGGAPAAGARIAFAAVDEGLLALQDNGSWDLLGAFMRPRPWGVETSTAQGEIVGRRHYGRKAAPPGGGGGRSSTRELFDTLLLWRGDVVLDANGEAAVDVPLNDSLTSFRLVAVADAGIDRFGQGSARVRVTQDLQVLPGLPPLAREGDRLDATLTLRNGSAAPQQVRATLAAAASAPAGVAVVPMPALPEQRATLAPGAAVELRWPVQVPAGATSVEWTAAAQTDGGGPAAQDRVRVVQRIEPAVPVAVWQSSLQPLEAGSDSVALQAPAGALPAAGVKAGGVQLTLLPRLAGTLPGVRRWFEQYPYRCLEQQSSKALALKDEAAWQRLGDELPTYLDADGLASWFPPRAEGDARGSDRLTAYLLAAAHAAGRPWPEVARERMLQGLTAFVDGRLTRSAWSPRPDLEWRRLAAFEALSRHGRVTPRQLGTVAAPTAQWPTSALLDWWLVLQRVQAVPERDRKLAEVSQALRARLAASGTQLRFSTEATDDLWWLMDGPETNAARLLLAAAEDPVWRADLPRLLTGALARQRDGAWRTTTANLWGTLAVDRFAAVLETQPVSGRSEARAGERSRSVDWAAEPQGASWRWAWAAKPETLSLVHAGTGRPWWSMQALAAVPLEAPMNAGYRLKRSIVAVEQRQAGRWSRGDVLRVRIELDASADMGWVVLDDPLPAGARVLAATGGLARDSAMAARGERREGAEPAFEERDDRSWRGYWETLPRGRHVVEYTLRLNASGRFALPPTRVEAMYAPDVFGALPNTALEVAP